MMNCIWLLVFSLFCNGMSLYALEEDSKTFSFKELPQPDKSISEKPEPLLEKTMESSISNNDGKELSSKEIGQKLEEVAQLKDKVDSLKSALDEKEQGEVPLTLWDKIKRSFTRFFEKVSSLVTSKLEDHEKKITKQVQYSLERFGSKLTTLDSILSEKERQLNERLADIARKDEVDKKIVDVESRLSFLDKSVNEGNIKLDTLAESSRKAAFREEVQKDLEDVRKVVANIESSLQDSKRELFDFISYKSGKAVSKDEVDTKFGTIETKIEFLGDSVNRKYKNLDEKLTTTLETKMSTTENILRSEINKRFNELRSHIQEKSENVSKRSDGDMSSLIRQAVKRHMHLTRGDYREDRSRRHRNKLRRLLDELDDD